MIVLDIEATCCNDGSLPAEDTETIEIGAVSVDPETWKVDREFSCVIRPVLHPILTPFCISLTGITQAEVELADTFKDVWFKFLLWTTGENSFCSWGRFDPSQLKKDCLRSGVQFGFSGHRDLAKFFSVISGRRKGNRGAMKILGLEPSGRHHRGLDDARNIVAIMSEIAKRGYHFRDGEA